MSRYNPNIQNPKSEIRNPKQIQRFKYLNFKKLDIVSSFEFRASDFPERGQAALVALLTIGVIVLILGVSIAVRGSTAVLSTARTTNSEAVFYAAQAGVEDALDRLTRVKDFTTTSDDANCNDTAAPEYLATIKTGYTVCVEVKNDIDVTTAPYGRIVTARATNGVVSRTIQVKLTIQNITGGALGTAIDTTSTSPGKLSITAWSEI